MKAGIMGLDAFLDIVGLVFPLVPLVPLVPLWPLTPLSLAVAMFARRSRFRVRFGLLRCNWIDV